MVPVAVNDQIGGDVPGGANGAGEIYREVLERRMSFDQQSRAAVSQWAGTHEPDAAGTHAYRLSDFGLGPDRIRERFAPYLTAFDIGP